MAKNVTTNLIPIKTSGLFYHFTTKKHPYKGGDSIKQTAEAAKLNGAVLLSLKGVNWTII